MINIIAALLAATVPATASIADMRQAISSACNDLPPVSAGRSSSSAWVAACDGKRQPVITDLWRIGQRGAPEMRLSALGLVAAWAPPPLAQAALERMVRLWRDADALSPAIEAAYDESRAPGKKMLLQTLALSRSHAVAGSAQYLLAAQALARVKGSVAGRATPLAMLRRIRLHYGDVPTTLLGAGDPPRLGRVASALLFRTERLMPGAQLPPMTAQDLDGHPVSSISFRGKVTLIDFWATWCPPCVAAMPTLRGVAVAHRGQPFQIVSISGDATPSPVKAFVTRSGNDWPQWRVGPSGTVSPEWSNSSFPFYLLVDQNGRIMAANQMLSNVLAELPGTIR